MATKRLAILGSRGIPARYGGFETFAQEISWRLADSGVDVTVFCEDTGPPKFKNVHLEYVSTFRLGPLSTIWFDVRCLWRARKSYDVVYMLGYGSSLFCVIPRFFRREVWINMDGIEWQRSKWSLIGRLLLKLTERFATWTATRLIVDAREIGSQLRERYRFLPTVSMIPYGVEPPSPPPDESLVRRFDVVPNNYCLVVCRLEPENHVIEIVKGYTRGGQDIPLVVVGNLQESNKYCRKLLEFQSDNVRFVGGVYDARSLWALRRYCCIYFHGHSVGGTNPSLLEAMAVGNPVIAHNNRFNREVLGELGVYFDEPEQIAPAARELLGLTQEQRNALGEQIRERARQRYSWESVRDAYLDLLSIQYDSSD